MSTCSEYFEVTVSPPVARNPEDSIPMLMLAPFSSIPKIDFQNVKVGSHVEKDVIIRNPTQGSIIIDLNIPLEMIERGFCVNALTFELSACSQTRLKIEWNPNTAGQWRDTIRVVHVNGKCKFAHILVTSSSNMPTNRQPLRRIPPSAANRVANVQKVAKTHIKTNYNLKQSTEVLKNPSAASVELNAPGSNQCVDMTCSERTKEIQEKFVLGTLPTCDLSPVQIHRTTYVKHPGFPPFHHNLPVISTDEEDHGNKSRNKTFDLGQNTTDQSMNDNFLTKGSDSENRPESILEISNLQLSPVNGLNLINKNMEQTDITLMTEEKIERNFERDSLENPCLPSRSIPCANIERSCTPPLSSSSSTVAYSFSVSPCVKLKRRNDDDTYNTYNFIKSPGSAIITSTVRKRQKQDVIISTLSPKSRVNFKKIPQKLFSTSKTGKPNQHIKLMDANRKVLDQSVASETSHPLTFYYETAYEDPFAKNALHTTAFLEKQRMELIKWLNSVLTPPEELSSVETGIDIEKLWKKSIATDVLYLAPTKDEVSTKYHADEGRLMAVRKAALALYKSEKVAKVLHGVHIKIEAGVFDVKDDLDLHCDQGVRYKLVQLVTYYNPLWLRIGLETIYNQVIYVPSNRDSLSALIYFLKKHFLSDNQIIKKNTYSKNTTYKMPNFKREMNSFIVFKFLALVFFLDKAKTERIIPYDPCLFRKSALIKESEALLNEFIKEFIKCVGAQKRTMAAIGYSLTHKQTYLDEYDFSVTSFQDLRDGVILTRAMEIILKKTHLSQQLRTPAVSRLQKVHNVKLSLDALRDEGYEITEDITAYDVVDGHHEKIMSLLWQILHRFLGPRYLRSATIIQKWWRKNLPLLKIKHKKRIASAIKIQAWWRGVLLRKNLPTITKELVFIKQEKANLTKQVKRIQTWYRSILLMKREKEKYLRKKHSAIKIQRWYRAHCETIQHVNMFRIKKNAIIQIQKWFRSILNMREDRRKFQITKYYTICIQRRYRSCQITKKIRNEFQTKRRACIKLQRWYRNVKKVQHARKCFNEKRNAAIIIQRHFRNLLETRKQQAIFNRKKQACITIQIWFKNVRLMKMERQQYLCLKEFVVLIQRKYRSRLEMKVCRENFLKTKHSIIIIQNWYRNLKKVQHEKKCFNEKRNAAVVIQRYFRGFQETRNQQTIFNSRRQACITIQRWFRSVLLMKSQRQQFAHMKEIIIHIQRRYRGRQEMRKQRKKFLQLKHSAIIIQNWYRNIKQVQHEKEYFNEKRNAAIVIQRYFRGLQETRKQQVTFNSRKQACIKIQRWFKRVHLMRLQRQRYLCLREFVILIQRRYRSRLEMKKQRERFLKLRHSIIIIQKWYRNKNEIQKSQVLNKQMKENNDKDNTMIVGNYDNQIAKQKIACITIINWWTTMKQVRKFKTIIKATITLQRWYRSWKETKRLRKDFIIVKHSCIIIQSWYRKVKKQREVIKMIKVCPFANMTPQERKEYDSAVIIQSNWRGYIYRKKFSDIVESIKKKVQIVKMTHGEPGISANERLIVLFDKAIINCCHDTFKLLTLKTLWLTFRNLDFITLHSPVLCEKLVQYDQFFAVAWDTLDLQTRSDPYIKVFGHILNIFINLARFEKTSASIHECLMKFNGYRILATLMGKTIEKHSSLFCKCVCLLWIVFSQDNGTAEVAKTDTEFRKKILYYYKQIVRKPIKKKANARRVIPHLVSDWGYKNVNREFSDEYAAISELLQVLKLTPP